MPRRAIIEALVAVQHISAKRNKQRKILRSDGDRKHSLARPGDIVSAMKTDHFVWALLPNYGHVLRTGIPSNW